MLARLENLSDDEINSIEDYNQCFADTKEQLADEIDRLEQQFDE